VNDGDEVEKDLHEALGESQRLGFLGDRPIPDVVEHARHFVTALAGVTGSVLDLGSGGGVPGLVVAVDRPDLMVTLLDRRSKRTDFLSRIVRRMRLGDRVEVVSADLGDAIRDGLGQFDAVIARGFGPPTSTLHAACRCLAPGGLVVISEPPSGDRWDPTLLDELHVERVGSVTGVVVRFRHVPRH
jgi:16S rRNA (guanine527-N7)-methyltransferase